MKIKRLAKADGKIKTEHQHYLHSFLQALLYPDPATSPITAGLTDDQSVDHLPVFILADGFQTEQLTGQPD